MAGTVASETRERPRNVVVDTSKKPNVISIHYGPLRIPVFTVDDQVEDSFGQLLDAAGTIAGNLEASGGGQCIHEMKVPDNPKWPMSVQLCYQRGINRVRDYMRARQRASSTWNHWGRPQRYKQYRFSLPPPTSKALSDMMVDSEMEVGRNKEAKTTPPAITKNHSRGEPTKEPNQSNADGNSNKQLQSLERLAETPGPRPTTEHTRPNSETQSTEELTLICEPEEATEIEPEDATQTTQPPPLEPIATNDDDATTIQEPGLPQQPSLKKASPVPERPKGPATTNQSSPKEPSTTNQLEQPTIANKSKERIQEPAEPSQPCSETTVRRTDSPPQKKDSKTIQQEKGTKRKQREWAIFRLKRENRLLPKLEYRPEDLTPEPLPMQTTRAQTPSTSSSAKTSGLNDRIASAMSVATLADHRPASDRVRTGMVRLPSLTYSQLL